MPFMSSLNIYLVKRETQHILLPDTLNAAVPTSACLVPDGNQPITTMLTALTWLTVTTPGPHHHNKTTQEEKEVFGSY